VKFNSVFALRLPLPRPPEQAAEELSSRGEKRNSKRILTKMIQEGW